MSVKPKKDENEEDLQKLCGGIKICDGSDRDRLETLELGWNIQNRQRKVFYNCTFSPVYQAMFLDDEENKRYRPGKQSIEEYTEDILKLLIKDLGFRADSVIQRKSIKPTGLELVNVTPAHAAVYNSKVEAFKAILAYNPDLDIYAELEESFDHTDFRLRWEGTVKDFVKKCGDWEFREALEEHVKKLKEEEKKKDPGLKLFGDLKMKFGKMEKFLNDEFGISMKTIDNLEKRRKELEKAETLHKQMEDIKNSAGYRTEDEVKSLKREIANFTKRKLDFDLDNCPICLDIPREKVNIVSCQQCGGIFCEPCMKNKKVAKCPLCQISLKTKPLVRSVLAEKLAKRYHSKM